MSKLCGAGPLSDLVWRRKAVDELQTRLDGFPIGLAPLADAARRLLDRPCDLSADGVLSIGHRPWVAPLNYAITLYPGLSHDWLERYCARFGLEVPERYAGFLAATNGAFCFNMALAGVPPSMLGVPPSLDRSRLQCHDLATAATLWSSEYRRVPGGAFHFGSRHYSARENVGYFLDGDRILSHRKNGRVVEEWGGLSEFLRDELQASEQLDAELHPSPVG